MVDGEFITEWPDFLDEAAFDYNSKPHTATKKTPYEVLYGVKCNTWVTQALGEIGVEAGPNDDSVVHPMDEGEEFAQQEKLEERRREIREGAQKSQAAATARYILDYNKRHRVGESKLVAGDKVMKTDMQK